ncbi:MAG: transglutaminase domain-containing protein [Planctomycetota bacterium]
MATTALILALATPLLQSATPQATPPSGPSAPAASTIVTRSQPRVRDVQLEVNLYAQQPIGDPTGAGRGQVYGINPYDLKQASIAIPVLTRTTWTDTDFTKSTVTLFVDSVPQKIDPATVFATKPGTRQANAVVNVNAGPCNDVRIELTYQVQQWSVSVDESAAAAITWPREWPKELQPMLASELGIRADDPAIKAVAEGASKGGTRSVTPYIAAKRAVTAMCARYRSVNQSTSEFGPGQSLRGIYFSQTAAGLSTGRATAVEFTADCVAALRSIGIPARVVYGLTLQDPRADKNEDRGNVRFRFIGEFWLPDAGWIPFDPVRMKGQGAATKATDAAVKGFGNVDDLGWMLPLAYAPVPEGYQKADRYAVWGWNLTSGSVLGDYAASRIRLELSSRGNGRVPNMPAPLD